MIYGVIAGYAVLLAVIGLLAWMLKVVYTDAMVLKHPEMAERKPYSPPLLSRIGGKSANKDEKEWNTLSSIMMSGVIDGDDVCRFGVKHEE